MKSLARLQVHLLVAMLIAALARPSYAGLPMVGLVEAAPGSGPRIVVLAVGLDAKVRPQLGLLEHAGETAIVRANRFELLPVVDAFDPTGRKGRETAAKQAASRVVDGQKALDDLDDPKATTAFIDALALLRQTNLAGDFEALIRAWVLKASSLATGGEIVPARQDIEKIIALAARTEFPPQFFSPELLQHAETQRRIASNAKGELTVRTEPPGAAVWVDGQYRGASPALVKNIMGGRHLVTAALGGYALGQEEMTPGEGLVSLRPAELQSALIKAQALISKDPEGLTREQAAMTLGKRVGADQVLLIIGKKSLAGEQIDLTALRLDVSDGHNYAFQTAVVPMNNEATVGSVLDLLLATDAQRVANRPVFHTKASGGAISGKRAAGLVLLGAGAALVGAGVFSGLQAQSTVATYRGTTQVQSSISDGLASRGRSFAIVADVSFVLGAASLALGTIFVATGKSAAVTAEPEPTPEPEPTVVKAAERPEEKKEEPVPVKPKTAPVREMSDWSKPRPAEVKPTPEPENQAETERRAKEAREAEAKKKDDEAKAAAQEKREQEEREKKEPKKKLSKKEERKLREKEEEERKAKEAEAKREEEARKKKDEEARKAKEAEAKKKDEEAKKKKKEDDHDDLRNY